MVCRYETGSIFMFAAMMVSSIVVPFGSWGGENLARKRVVAALTTRQTCLFDGSRLDTSSLIRPAELFDIDGADRNMIRRTRRRRRSTATARMSKSCIRMASDCAPIDPGPTTSSLVATMSPPRRDDNHDDGERRSWGAIASSLSSSVRTSTNLLDALSPHPDRDVDRIGPIQLAFLGDVVYELFVRSRYIWPNRRTADLQSKVVATVRAEAQSELLKSMTSGLVLIEKERAILTRGRNAGASSSGARRRRKGCVGNADGGGAAAYQDSTAFESLLGYMYMSDAERCFEMLSWIRGWLDKADGLLGGPVVPRRSEATSLIDLLMPHPDGDADQINGVQLAYLGDVVFELFVRARYVWPNMRGLDLHNKVVSVCRAETQSLLYGALLESDSFHISPKEMSVMSRGRNAGCGNQGRSKRRSRRGGTIVSNVAAMQDSTALEALLGYLYMTNREKCLELLDWVAKEIADRESKAVGT